MRYAGAAGVAATLVAGILGAVVLASNVAIRAASLHAAFDARTVPATPVAVVFGAGVEPDGAPSVMLGERLALAVELYRSRKVERILLSAVDRRDDREIPAMTAFLAAARIPRGRVIVDSGGASTRETCRRARSVFGLHAVTLVTQDFHLPRALFVCRAYGLAPVGVGVPDWGKYTVATMLTHTARETLADASAAVRVAVGSP